MNLDQAQLNALQPKDRAQYMALEHLFAQPGWKYVIALAEQRAKEQVQRAAFATSWDGNRLAIGAGAAWDEISKLEQASEARYLNMIEEAERAAAIAAAAEEAAYE